MAELDDLKAKLIAIIDEYKTVSKAKAVEFQNITKDREGTGSDYKNQRDNPIEGDVTCNVTSVAMQLIKLANGDETKVRTEAVALCKAKGISATESTELEEMLRQLSISANGGKKQINGLNCYMYPNILNAVAKMFKGLVSETREVFGAGVVTAKNIEELKTKLKAELAKGAALRSSSKLTHGGHIVAITDYKNDGLVINDPYGARFANGYVKNGDSAGNAKTNFNESLAATRFKHNSAMVASIKDAISRGVKLPSNVGEKNFYTWAEVDTYDIGRNVQAMSGNIANVQANTSNDKPAETTQNPAAAKTISDTVGENGKNKPEDVLLIKSLLNKFGAGLDPKNTNCGPQTIAAIKKFQQEKAGLKNPDGLISPNGTTWRALNATSGGATQPVNNLESMRTRVEELRTAARAIIEKLDDKQTQIAVTQAQLDAIKIYSDKATEFLAAYNGADAAQKKAIDDKFVGYVADLKTKSDWVKNSLLPKLKVSAGNTPPTTPTTTGLTTWDSHTNTRIGSLDSRLKAPAAAFINDVEKELGIKLRVTSGFRDLKEQDALFDKGGVTKARGGQSYHNYGLAIDICIIKDGKADFLITREIANIGKRHGWDWGNDVVGTWDKPHFQNTFGKSVKELCIAKYPERAKRLGYIK